MTSRNGTASRIILLVVFSTVATALEDTYVERVANALCTEGYKEKTVGNVEACASLCRKQDWCTYFSIEAPKSSGVEEGGKTVCRYQSVPQGCVFHVYSDPSTIATTYEMVSAAGLFLRFNFRMVDVSGYIHDAGVGFGPQNDHTYGWTCDGAPKDFSSGIRDWGNHFDRWGECSGRVAWELQLPNGDYDVKIAFNGDGEKGSEGCKVQGMPHTATHVTVEEERFAIEGSFNGNPSCHSIIEFEIQTSDVADENDSQVAPGQQCYDVSKQSWCPPSADANGGSCVADCKECPGYTLAQDADYTCQVDSIRVEGVYLAQTHVQAPGDPMMKLIGSRAAVLKVQVNWPQSSGAPKVTATVTEKSGDLTELTLNGPSSPPGPFDARIGRVAHKAEDSFLAVIPAELVAHGMSVSVKVQDLPDINYDLPVGPPIDIEIKMFDVSYFGLDDGMDYPAGWEEEVVAKFPMSSLTVTRTEVTFPELVTCYYGETGPVRTTSPEHFMEKTGLDHFDGEQGAALQWVEALARSNGNLYMGLTWVNIVGVSAGGQACCLKAVSSRNLGIFSHEAGHAFSLPHWDASEPDYPYNGPMYGVDAPKGREPPTHVGPTWAFDLDSMTFIPPTVQEGGNAVGIAGEYKLSPMYGGGSGDEEPEFMLRHFSDYGMYLMYDYLESMMTKYRPEGECLETETGMAYCGPGYFEWDDSTGLFSKRKVPGEEGVVQDITYPMETDLPVISVLACTSLTNADINMVYPPVGPYTGNLVRNFDANDPEDREAAKKYYCGPEGCQYTLRVVQGGVERFFILAGATDADADFNADWGITTVAVNLAARDGMVTEADLLKTPDVEKLGMLEEPERLWSWKQTDGELPTELVPPIETEPSVSPKPAASWYDLGCGDSCANIGTVQSSQDVGSLADCKRKCEQDAECTHIQHGFDDEQWCVTLSGDVADSSMFAKTCGSCGARTYRLESKRTADGSIDSSSSPGEDLEESECSEKVKITFGTDEKCGYINDPGQGFGDCLSQTFGWTCDGEPQWQASGRRTWGNHFDRYNWCQGTTAWMYEVPNGQYNVHVTFGDGDISTCKVQGHSPTSRDFDVTVVVTDGRLSISGDFNEGEPHCHSIVDVTIETAAPTTSPPSPAPAVCTPSEWMDLEKECSNCAALVTLKGRTCETYCSDQGLHCKDAWDDATEEQCSEWAPKLGCQHQFDGTSDAICQCALNPVTSPDICADGYTYTPGDIPGWGEVEGLGGGETVSSCTECAQMCDSKVGCRSYECSSSENKCNLNLEAAPTKDVYKDYKFCVKTPACPSVTVTFTHGNDMYFNFDKDAWLKMTGESKVSGYWTVKQTGADYNWEGKVVVWDNHNGVHGRRDSGASSNQWNKGDEISIECIQ